MPKYIITQIDRYEIEGNSGQEVMEQWRSDLINETYDFYDYLDGKVIVEERESND